MNNNTIEKAGIGAINTYLCKLGYIDPHLNSDNTIPMWDGSLFVYKSRDDFSNPNFEYQIPAQVKAEVIKGTAFPETTVHSIKLVDLKNYLSDGGLVFFKVLINADLETCAYCAFLNKTAIQKLIDGSEKQTKTVTLYKAPADSLVFLEELKRIHIQKQHEQIDLDALNNIKDYNFNIKFDHIPTDANVMEYLTNHSADLMVNIKNIPGEFYAKGGPYTVQITQSVPANVSIGDHVFYNSYSIIYKKDGAHLYFGKSVELIQPYKTDADQSIKITVKLNADTLESVIHELEFIACLSKQRVLTFGDNTIDIPNTDTENKVFELWEKELNFWKDVKKVFTILHVTGTFNPRTLTKKQDTDLKALIQSFVYNKPVYCDEGNDVLYTVKIEDLNIVVYAHQVNGREYKLLSIYDVGVCYYDENKIQRITPIYSAIFSTTDLPSNLYLKNIIEDYKLCKKQNDQIAIQANQDLLNMLNHYDKCHSPAILEAAVKLATWLKKDEKNIIGDNNIVLLNYLQTIKRKNGTLTFEQKKKLFHLKTTDNIVNIARFILLDEKEKAQSYLDKISDNDVAFLKTLPIYYFMNN